MISYPSNDFLTATPESQGVLSSAIADMLAAIRDTGKDIHSMLLYRHGRLIFEQYFAPYTAETPHSMFSCSKTFTSMLIGIAQEKGLLKLTDHVLDFFPDVPVENPNDNLRAMTIRDLLIMGTGHGEDTFGYMTSCEDGDWARVFLNRPVDHKPGTYFVYNTGATYMLSAILTRVSGKSTLALAEEWIFQYIGIRGAVWDTCPKGICMGGTGLHIRPRDMLRFGVLMLAGGRWCDRQIIPLKYLQEAQHKQIDNYNREASQHPCWKVGYGYQLWRCAFPAFRADGMGGQYIVMFPALDMVAVFTSALNGDISYPLDIMEEHLLPAVFSAPQAVDPAAVERLAALSREAAHPEPSAMPEAAAAFPFGKRFDLPENRMELTALTVREQALELKTKNGDCLTAAFAWEAPLLNEQPVSIPLPARISALARWKEDSLYLRLSYLGEPLTVHFTLTPAPDGQVRVFAHSTLFGDVDAVCAPQA